MRYFFYGTLMDRTVLAAVLGRSLPPAASRPASLDGYRRVFRAGASYPVLVPAAGEVVAGIVVDGLGQGDRRRLEAFEGSDYVSREMPVRLGRGGHRGGLGVHAEAAAAGDGDALEPGRLAPAVPAPVSAADCPDAAGPAEAAAGPRRGGGGYSDAA